MSDTSVILVSGSPRRSELLHRIGIPHSILIPDVDESARAGESIDAYVVRLAIDKYRAGARIALKDRYLIAADTMVELSGEWLGKPHDRNDAIHILRKMSDQKHTVWTGVAIGVSGSERMITICDRSEVTFVAMSLDEIEAYVTSGEPLDKAGAYGVQGFGARYVQRIEGCFFNVMGLPVSKVYKGLQELGWRE